MYLDGVGTEGFGKLVQGGRNFTVRFRPGARGSERKRIPSDVRLQPRNHWLRFLRSPGFVKEVTGFPLDRRQG